MGSPILFEINTRAWLRELSEKAGHPVLLEDIPQSEIDRWKALGFTHIWLMGVWQVGPKARARALESQHADWKEEYLSDSDIQGSPYAIQEYSVDRRIGEPLGLLLLKERLNSAGLKLIVDFVPNHLGIDSPEIFNNPGRFVQSASEAAGTFPAETRFGERFFAHGRDPYFPPWTDTVQVDYRVPQAHEAMAAVAQTISMYGNGLRCDMAMLLLPEIFQKTWSAFPPASDFITHGNFWREAIPKIRQLQPQVDLIAEAYWDTEETLQSAGFDFTYNKRVYDYLVQGRIAELSDFLNSKNDAFLAHSVHFLENHDEPRIANLLAIERHKAAAALMFFLPGMVLLHDGQMEGRRAFARIQANRRKPEPIDAEISRFYNEFLEAIQKTHVRRSEPALLRSPDCREIIAVKWDGPEGEFDLALVNLSAREQEWKHSNQNQSSALKFSLLYSTKADAPAFNAHAQSFALPPESAAIFRCTC
jgi:glycosidase